MGDTQQAVAPEEEEQLASAEEQHLMRIGKRCYVGNLAWKTSWQDLKDTFRECGSVVYANVMRDDTGKAMGQMRFAWPSANALNWQRSRVEKGRHVQADQKGGESWSLNLQRRCAPRIPLIDSHKGLECCRFDLAGFAF